MSEAVGQRGKLAEKEVESVLKKFNNRADFAYHRMPDARAAMGRLAASPADFLYFFKDSSGFIEVKSTKHAFRLPRASFSQLPTLCKFAEAGAASWLLVHHSEQGLWRCVQPEALSTDTTSWDLSAWRTYDNALEALEVNLLCSA